MLGITGTGGSGKSSLTDELVRRFRLDQEDKLRIAVLAVDPTRRKGGGALLGDRIRMNSLGGPQVYFRSMASRGGGGTLPEHLADAIALLRASGVDLVIVETPGIGQGDAGIVDHVDASLYVMTPEFGAASQLEKIDMLDFADVVAINKFERRGADDARRDVARQLVRNRDAFSSSWEDMPVYGTSAATFHDDGVTALYGHLRSMLAGLGLSVGDGRLTIPDTKTSTDYAASIPPERARYLADVAGDGARLPPRDRVDGRGRAEAPGAAAGPPRRSATATPARCRTCSPRRSATCRARPRHCWTPGPPRSRPTPATRWSSTCATRSCARS